MTIVADLVDYSIGVDTHRDSHCLVIIDAGNNAVIGQRTIETTATDFESALAWVEEHAPGLRVWAVEGTGSYGAGLWRHLNDQEEWVIEVERPARPKRQRADKDDSIDAKRAAKEALGLDLDEVVVPKQGETRETLALLVSTRHSAVRDATAAKNALHAAVMIAPDNIRRRFDNLSGAKKVVVASELCPDDFESTNQQAHVQAIKLIAERIRFLEAEAKTHEKNILAMVNAWRPDLIELYGVGAIVAARILIAWSHAGRCRSEAAFAMLSGTAPIPASSGRTTGRYRLNPGGDRQTNSAIHTIALTRMRGDEETKAYVQRRRAEGKSDQDIRRCLKRYIARQLFKQLEQTNP